MGNDMPGVYKSSMVRMVWDKVLTNLRMYGSKLAIRGNTEMLLREPLVRLSKNREL